MDTVTFRQEFVKKDLRSATGFAIIVETKGAMAMETRRQDPERRKRMQLRKQIEWGRWAILGIVAMTLLNQILLWCGVEYHLIFSAAMPYYLNWLAGELGGFWLKLLATLLTLLLYASYGACWLLSGHRRDWLAAAIGLYVVDTVILLVFSLTLLANPGSCVLEILTHLVALVPLVIAYRSAEQLSRMPRQRRAPRVQE